MEIRVVDFDVLTKNYKNYQDGVKEMSDYRVNFIKKLVMNKNISNQSIQFTSNRIE